MFRQYYGPVHKAFAALDPAGADALDPAGADALEQEVRALLERLNTAGPQSLVVPGEYLEVIVEKRRA